MVAVITSGQGGRTAPIDETYAMPIEWARKILPPFSRCWHTAFEMAGIEGAEDPSAEPAIAACIEARLEQRRAPLPFSERAYVVSGHGLLFGIDHAEKVITFAAPPGFEIVPPVRVLEFSAVGQHGHEGPTYSYDAMHRVTSVSLKVWTHAPAKPLGSGAMYDARLEGVMRRIVNDDFREQIRNDCRVEASFARMQ